MNDVWLVKYSIFENSKYSKQDSSCVFFFHFAGLNLHQKYDLFTVHNYFTVKFLCDVWW